LTSMNGIFGGCYSLTSLDVTSFNTSNVTDMYDLFYGCSGLTRLDLSSFNTAKVKTMAYMFMHCRNLVSIYVDDGWNTEAVTYSTNMFTNCTSIRGDLGTTYDEDHVDKAYAHLDGGTANPGYLSMKPEYTRGDVDDNGQVNITDVIKLISAISTNNFDGINTDAANVNGDAEVNITDVIMLINYVSTGQW
jgi:surface protein